MPLEDDWNNNRLAHIDDIANAWSAWEGIYDRALDFVEKAQTCLRDHPNRPAPVDDSTMHILHIAEKVLRADLDSVKRSAEIARYHADRAHGLPDDV